MPASPARKKTDRRAASTPHASRALTRAVRRALESVADPAKAGPMQAYMKSEMPYLGVQKPHRTRVLKPVFAEHGLESFDAWQDSVLALWRNARYREERYAALALAELHPYDQFQRLKTLPMYEELIVTGAWWDYVDDVAIGRLGALLQRYPGSMKPRMRTWSRSRDMWKRRSSIICQIRLKDGIDLDLLYDCIEPSIGESGFFLRKAIGWALRQHAWIDPHEVVRYVRSRKDDLSGLSRREALRNVVKAGIAKEVP